MKNVLLVFLTLLLFSSCKKKEVSIPVSSVTIDRSPAATIRLDESPLRLIATVMPENATSKAVIWTTSDPAVATVSEGLVTPVKTGEVTIFAKAGDITANCLVKVLPPLVAVAGISLEPQTVSIVIGQTSTLTATISPMNASDKTIVWGSDNEGIASVSNGVVTAGATGTCTITAKSFSDQTKAAACRVTVVEREIPVTDISFNETTANILVDDTRQLTATISPENATNKNVNWSTSNSSVAVVSTTGLVTAKRVGSANIIATAAANPDRHAVCAVTVTDRGVAVTGLSVFPPDTIVAEGAGFQLRHRIMPVNATHVGVTYESSDETKALVSEKGFVFIFIRATGTATITVKSVADPTKISTCRLTIRPRVQSITVSPDAITLLTGKKYQLATTVMPDAADKTVDWSSADKSKATVSGSGEVTAHAPGQVRITATAKDGSRVTNFSTVTVEAGTVAVAGISLDPQAVSIVIGQTSTLTAAIAPENATDKNIIWTSEKENIATVSRGIITARATGTCMIIAKSFSDQTKMAACEVTVVAREIPVTAISPDVTTANILVDGTRQLVATIAPENATNKEVIWSTSNVVVAEISTTGLATTCLVTAKSVGTSTITMTSAANPAITAACQITVTNRGVAVTGLSVFPADTTIAAGAGFRLRHRITPANATRVDVAYESGDQAKAIVSANGFVTTGVTGEVTLTVKSLADPTKRATCRLTVRPRVQNIIVTPDAVTLPPGQKRQLTATVTPSDAADLTVKWSSSDESKATVSNTGEVTAVTPGRVRISATAKDGSNTTNASTITVEVMTVAVAGISLDPSTVSIVTGETSTLTAIFAPSNATDKTVVWTSSNENIATIGHGIITARATGTCFITAKSFSDQTKMATCAVTVVAREIPVTGISLDAAAANILLNDTRLLVATIAPENATDRNVTWSTSDASVAEVSTTGLVTAKTVGTATVTATSAANPTKTAACAVTVTNRGVAVTALSVVPADTTVTINTGFQLRHRIEPANATNINVTYESSDETKAGVSRTGLVIVGAIGEATITVKSAADPTKTATCRLTIKPRVQSITVSPDVVTLPAGQKRQLTAAVMPDAANKMVTWSSSDVLKATVSNTGEVTAVAPGPVRITATARDGSNVAGSSALTVVVAVAGISLNPTAVSLAIGETRTLAATITPDNAADKTVVWSSNKENIATVSHGVITPVATGTCVITARSAGDPTKTATCAVTVTAQVVSITGISLDAAAALSVNRTRQLIATITPENAHNKGVLWSTSNAAVAEVSATGLVTAKMLGAATITATAEANPSFTAACQITVSIAVTGLSLAPSDTTVAATASFQLRHRIIPANATDTRVTYESSDAAKATVSPTGLVTALAVGDVILTIKSVEDPTKKGISTLTVTPVVRVQSITLSPSGTIYVSVGQKRQLTATVLPANATNRTVTWAGSSPSATVSNSGEVTGLSPGELTITATANDASGIVARAAIAVLPRTVSITILPANPVATKGETLQLTSVVYPTGALSSLQWSSGDPSKATINPSTGLVTGVEAGTARITATAIDGSGVSQEVTLTVQLPLLTASIANITLGAENFTVTVPDPGATAVVNNIPHTVASNFAEVQVNIAAPQSAIIKIGNTVFRSGNKVNFNNPVTFSVTEEGKRGSKEYTLNITPYNKETNPYGIYTVIHLNDMRNAVNEGFKLMKDITMPRASDLTGIDDYSIAGWKPVGGEDTPFTGSLDGAGHKIENFYINRAALYVGLFGKTGNGATIKNLKLFGRQGPETDNDPYYSVTGTANNGNQYSGLLAGYNGGLISNCYASGNITSNSSTPMTTGIASAGGLVGYCNNGTVSNSYTSGITYCTAASADVMAGGLVGYCDNKANVTGCYSAGKVLSYAASTNSSAYSGGLVGHCDNGTAIIRSYSTSFAGAASNSTDDQDFRLEGAIAGGLVGSCNRYTGSNGFSTVNNCFATGNAIASCTKGGFASVGGLVGAMYHSGLYNSYATGNVIADSDKGYQNLSTILGYYYSDATIRSNCYRNSDATVKKGTPFEGKSAKSYDGTDKTLAEMKTATLKDNLNQGQGTAVWGWNSAWNDGLPYIIDVGVGNPANY